MPRWRLSTILVSANVALIVATSLGVGVAALGLMRRLADDAARDRAEREAVRAVEAIDRTGQDLLTAAQVLSERPTLQRLLGANDAFELSEFLTRFRQTSGLDGCAVFAGGRLVASSGSLPWEEMRRRSAGPGGRLLARFEGQPALLSTAWVGVKGAAGGTVLAGRLLDEAYVEGLDQAGGLAMRLVDRETALAEATSGRSDLLLQTLGREEPVAARGAIGGRHRAAAPVRGPDGAVVGVVEASLPADAVSPPVRRLVTRLLLLTLASATTAALFNLLVGRRIIRPLGLLTEASTRIGRGDLSSPVPRAGAGEAATLASEMEKMRHRLLQLTVELRRRQAEAEAILTGIAEGVFAVDRERRIRYMNPQALAFLGRGARDAVGRFCGDVLNPAGPGGARPCEERCPILDARFSGGALATEHLVLPGGERRTVVITSAPPAPGDPGIEAADHLQYQVMRAETEIEATRRLRDMVVANISHEFRTPLTAQLASIELLRDSLPRTGGDEAQELLRSLERGALRLTRLIDNLLESSRIEAGRDSIRRQPVALDEVIEEAVELTAPLIEQRGQELSVDLPYPLPQVTGDPTRLTQVFVNLLANANKFAPAGSPIGVGGSVTGTDVTLWVEDEGPGLPPGAGDTIFEPYMRAPGGDPEESGMGLGLWIVKSIITRHGGRVEARRGARGTRMCIVLPRPKSDEDPGRR
jgi:signal transduction histidine kinase